VREKERLLLEVGRIHNRPSREFATALHFATVTASGDRETQMNQAEHTETMQKTNLIDNQLPLSLNAIQTHGRNTQSSVA